MNLENVLPNTGGISSNRWSLSKRDVSMIDNALLIWWWRWGRGRGEKSALLDAELYALELAVEQECAKAVGDAVIGEKLEQERVELERWRVLAYELIHAVEELQEDGRETRLIVYCVIVAAREP